jgi:hypothetical protein
MIENYKNERLKEFNTIEEALVELNEFVKNDYTYERYLTDPTFEPDEAEILNINHIKAIVKIIELEKKKKKEEGK